MASLAKSWSLTARWPRPSERRPRPIPSDPNQIAAPLPGLVVGVAVVAGDPVRKGQKLLSIEAMKMETTLYAERPGRVVEVLTSVGSQVKTGELLIRLSAE